MDKIDHLTMMKLVKFIAMGLLNTAKRNETSFVKCNTTVPDCYTFGRKLPFEDVSTSKVAERTKRHSH